MIALLGLIAAMAAKNGFHTTGHAQPEAAMRSTTALFQWSAEKATPATDTTPTPLAGQRAVTPLAGRFSPADEKLVHEQLRQAGYLYFLSYRHHPDGSATLQAIHGNQAVQPVETIRIDPTGHATHDG